MLVTLPGTSQTLLIFIDSRPEPLVFPIVGHVRHRDTGTEEANRGDKTTGEEEADRARRLLGKAVSGVIAAMEATVAAQAEKFAELEAAAKPLPR